MLKVKHSIKEHTSNQIFSIDLMTREKSPFQKGNSQVVQIQ